MYVKCGQPCCIIDQIIDSYVGSDRQPRFVPEDHLRDDLPPADWPECNRAEGGVPCVYCGKPLYDHYCPVPVTCPTMVEDCGGNWWKL